MSGQMSGRLKAAVGAQAKSSVIKFYCHDRLNTAQRSICQNTVQPQRLNEICMKGKAGLKFACYILASCSHTTDFNSGDLAPGNPVTTVKAVSVYITKAWLKNSNAFVALFLF